MTYARNAGSNGLGALSYDVVATIRDGAGPWRVSTVHGGHAYWSARFEDVRYGPDDVWVEWRAYDKSGDLVDPDLLPDHDFNQLWPPD